jgi:nuclear protein localization protein 4 homolog
MLIRVRNNTGLWRVELSGTIQSSATVQDVLRAIQVSRPHVLYTKPMSFDPAYKQPIDTQRTLSEQGIGHGSMIYCAVDPTTTLDITAATSANAATAEDSKEGGGSSSAVVTQSDSKKSSSHMKRVIGADGTIQLIPTNDSNANPVDRGFRKGMLALRDMKMHWTCKYGVSPGILLFVYSSHFPMFSFATTIVSDFISLDSQYEFKIQRQEQAICQQVSLDVPSISNFQAYLQQFSFQQKRIGYLYGRFIPSDDDTTNTSSETSSAKLKCIVEAIYEPSQEADTTAVEGFVLHDDNAEEEETVTRIASMLGLQRVGWIFGHAYRNATEYTLSASEVIMAAEFQLEAAEGVHETPFVTVTVAPSANGTVSVEAFQVSQQCMAMVAEEALEVDVTNPKVCRVNETFTAIQEGKESTTIDTSFFLTVVPIAQHTSELLVAEFPRMNRPLDQVTPSTEAMKKHLSKSGTAGWTFVDRLADLHLLIYLSKFLDLDADFPKICAAIVDRANTPLDDGYKLIIKSLAGMDGSY